MTQTAAGAGSPRRTPRIAANPIPYWSRDGKINKSKECSTKPSLTLQTSASPQLRLTSPGDVRQRVRGLIGSYGLGRR